MNSSGGLLMLIALSAIACGGKSGTSMLVPTPSFLAISPASLELSPGDERQLLAVVEDQFGSPMPDESISWQTTNERVASVDDQGLVRAVATGNAEIDASSGGLDASVSLRVASTSPTARLANECDVAPAAWIWCDDFDQDRLDFYFEHENPNGSFERVAGVGVEASTGMRARFRRGQVNAGALHLALGRTPQAYIQPADAGTLDHRELYWRIFLRYQAGWVGGGGDKLSRATSLVTSDWAQAMVAHVWSGNTDSTRDFLIIDPASGTDEAGNLRSRFYNDTENVRWLGSARGTTPIFDSSDTGRWYCIEARVRLNDPGREDGVFALWIDDVVQAQRTDLNWLGTFDEYGINAIFLENYWNLGSPAEQERHFDNFVVSSERIGCGSG